MVALIASADHALWYDDGPDRYKRLWVDVAMCLEQAMATLQTLADAPDPINI